MLGWCAYSACASEMESTPTPPGNTAVSRGPQPSVIARCSESSFRPSSSQDSSNSFEPTIPYQYWCPYSWTVTISIPRTPRENHLSKIGFAASPVMNVGYSIPPDPVASSGGSTTVSVSYGYAPYQSP